MSNLENAVDANRTPKKILTCDGGGIRGLISVEILAKIESDLRKKTKDNDLVLGDWFDFACGTSTGAIIATCIAAGMTIEEIRSFYVDSGALMFDKARIWQRLKFKYNDEPLARLLQSVLNEHLGADDGENATLGSQNLRCLLMLVLRNHSTDSPWPIWNNPRAKYNQTSRADCNLRLPLWQLVRASTAAPTYFPPETITLGEGSAKPYDFVFVDGGVTTYNNPAFLAFQLATAEPYKLQWNTGVDKMLLVSVGTGQAASEKLDEKADDLWLVDHAKTVPGALMNAAAAGWDMACRNLGDCRFGASIDREFGHMTTPKAGQPPNSSVQKLFAYVRYNPTLDEKGLAELDLDVAPENIRKLDSTEHAADLREVGERYAERKLDPIRDFAGFV